MCLIAYQPHNDKPFEKSIFDNGWDANKHGAGYMFVADGKLVIRKPFFKLKELRKAYRVDHAMYGEFSPFVMHFRFATHGLANETNTHPHILADGKAGLVHNGILNVELPKGCEISDTVFFCRTTLAYRQASFLTGLKCNRWLGEMIGKFNKFVIMDWRGKVSIVNESAGVWDGSRWFSNYGYVASVPVRSKFYTKWDWQDNDEIIRGVKLADDAIPSFAEERSFSACYDYLLDRALESCETNEIDWDKLDEEAWRMAKQAMAEDDDGEIPFPSTASITLPAVRTLPPSPEHLPPMISR